MKIGNLTLQNNIFMAPLAGVADSAFRQQAKKFGAGLCYSEMISAKGVHYKSKGSIELSDFAPVEAPFAVQIFGSEPDIMAEAAKLFENKGASLIDINMGCPVPKVVGNGEGSALMKNPVLVGQIVNAVSSAVSIPVTVKMRRGFTKDNENAPEIAVICEENGAAAVCVHGRFRDQFYSGLSSHEAILRVKESVKIPVIASGDVVDIDSAVKTFAETKCDAIMIGRGALGSPWIFQEILSGTPVNRTAELIKSTAIEQLRTTALIKGDHTATVEMRKHMAWYVKGIRNNAELKRQFCEAKTVEEMVRLIEDAQLENCR